MLPLVLALFLVFVGTLLFGIGLGRHTILRLERRVNITRSSGPLTESLMLLGGCFFALGLVIGSARIIYSADRMFEHADRIRSSIAEKGGME